ncbi:hypothetical protein PEDI_03990 [Persicobacter diffluens]|uniref:Uroporphyrinogen decarboxylase n=1 Tax=Persicobacter diffluens TaxID=981 RepID=A0AAN5AII1_9BACT|nr:hypothetical protein PEDI_03990 [Persicobacter diffluens]
MDYSDWVGYIAMTLVALSFTFKEIRKLRLINSIGAVFFVIYGVMIQAYPVVVVNSFIAIFNIYHLFNGSSRS